MALYDDPHRVQPQQARPHQDPPRQRQRGGQRPLQSAFDDPRLRAYISEYAKRQRENDAKATEASNKWLARKAWLTAYIEKNQHLYQSEKAKRDKMAGDWALQDAMDAWSWHTREAARCHAAIDTAIKMAQLADGTL